MERAKVYGAIDTERNFQDRKWGTVKEHPHEVGGWITLMRKLLHDAEVAWSSSRGDSAALEEIRKVIAVGVACGEQHGLQTREDLSELMARIRNEMLPGYVSAGPLGSIAAGMIKASLADAEAAIADGDAVAMMQAYRDLKEYGL